MQETKRCGFDSWVRKIPGGGNGSPLQYPYLKNFMDRGALRCTVHTVAMRQTRLSTHRHTVIGTPTGSFAARISLLEADFRIKLPLPSLFTNMSWLGRLPPCTGLPLKGGSARPDAELYRWVWQSGGVLRAQRMTSSGDSLTGALVHLLFLLWQ